MRSENVYIFREEMTGPFRWEILPYLIIDAHLYLATYSSWYIYCGMCTLVHCGFTLAVGWCVVGYGVFCGSSAWSVCACWVFRSVVLGARGIGVSRDAFVYIISTESHLNNTRGAEIVQLISLWVIIVTHKFRTSFNLT